MPPKPANMTFYPSAAAAQQAGFRACKRCRPDAVPGLAGVEPPADLVGRAMRLIADGVVDREGVTGPGRPARLQHPPGRAPAARRAGRGPARARPGPARADRTAADRDHRAADGGHRLRGRVRQHPPVQRHRARGLRPDPTELRDRAREESAADVGGAGACRCGSRSAPRSPRQPVRPPGGDRRTRGGGVARRRLPADPAAAARARDRRASRRTRPRRLPAHAERPARPVRRDQPLPPAARPGRRPVAVDDHCGGPVLAPLVDKAPGRRVPRTVDEAEFALRAVLGQQVSTAARPYPRGPAGRRARRAASRTPRAASPTSSPSLEALAGWTRRARDAAQPRRDT